MPNRFTYHTYHPYNTNHSCHTYHTYHTYHPYNTNHSCHTRPTIHTIHTQHTIPHPHHTTGGRGTVLGPQVAPPFPSICKLLAAFLRSSFVFARSLQHFWLPASHLLGTCYLLGGLRSTHTPSKYLRATYSHIYLCYVSTVSTSYLLPVYPDNTTCV